MNINIITSFPELIKSFIKYGLISKGIEKNIIKINIIDLRDFGIGKYRAIDDYPYGGLSGMVLRPEPLTNALKSLKDYGKVVFPNPTGQLLKQDFFNKMKNENTITLIASRYKGIDQRFIDKYVDYEVSIGDYIIQGGEIPCMILIEGIVRLLPNFINNDNSAKTDSFNNGLLEGPLYTRPEEFENMKVPEVLLSGNHKKIEQWNKYMSIKRTFLRRKDLIEQKHLTDEQKRIINIITSEDTNEEN